MQWLRKNELDGLFPAHEQRFNRLIWNPSSEDRKAAWHLYAEICTRVTTQPLPYRSGDEDTALDSVYSLFGLSRSIIRDNFGCSHFATLTMEVLNTTVRPFTAKWHPLKVDGRLASADVRFAFRIELTQLQKQLKSFARLLKLIIADERLIPTTEEQLSSEHSNLFRPVSFKILPDRWIPSQIEEMNQLNNEEQKEVLERRQFYDIKNKNSPINAIGLSVSGGGIRSATFALGVVQVLARRGVLPQVDYLSTVSGGGYLGSFISSYLNSSSPRVSLASSSGHLPFGSEHEGESQAVRHLRNHSKYLSEGGWKTRATMIGLVVYGIFVSALLLSPLILLPALAVKLFTLTDASWGISSPSTFTASDKWLLAGLVGVVLLLPITQFRNPRGAFQRAWQIACIAIGGAFVLWKILEVLRWVLENDSRKAVAVLGLAIVCVVFLAVWGLWLGTQSKVGRLLVRSLAAVGPLLVTLLFLCVSKYVASMKEPTLTLAVTTGAILLYTMFVLNINYVSPHLFYRSRLARTYLTRTPDGDDSVSAVDPQPLSKMNASRKAPYHLINAALNIPSCDNPNLRGRNTDFFLFSKHFCGSPIVGYRRTAEWEAVDGHLDLGTAMAISGAAAAPQMGTVTSPQYTFLLAMMNVRLGYWLRRPLEHTVFGSWLHRILPPMGWYYFFRELTGSINEKTAYLNVSDGGHIENLGIYELLRRRCKFIIAIDGEADPKRSFGGLLTLTQFASIDLGVRIEPDLSDLRIDRDGQGNAHFGLSKVEYSGGEHGLLLYIKSSLTGNESEFLQKYHREHPDFPHQSTAQQLFSETQFEAYRALGEHIAGDLFRSDLVGGQFKAGTDVEMWFKELAHRLL
jgi:hypothetical protein